MNQRTHKTLSVYWIRLLQVKSRPLIKKEEIERISILMCFIPQLVSCTNKDGTNCYIHSATHDNLKLKALKDSTLDDLTTMEGKIQYPLDCAIFYR